MTSPHLLAEARESEATRALAEADVADFGYVMNLTRLWSHLPEAKTGLVDLFGIATKAGELSIRQRGILITALASALGDSYCSLAWGRRLAAESSDETAAAVLAGNDSPLDEGERALAGWARKVTKNPNGIGQDDVDRLRAAGWSDRQIFAITVYVALRIAFSTVNDALGALPDAALRTAAPRAVLETVSWGRPVAE